MSFPSSTRKEELDELLNAILDLLIRHEHTSVDFFSKISFLNLKDLPPTLISTITGEDPIVRSVRPKLLDGDVVLNTTIPDGIIKDFKLPWKTISESEVVFLQGRRQRRNIDYTLNAEYLSFTEAPPINSIILVDLSPLAPSPDPTSPKYVVNEIPLQQFNDLVFFTKVQTNTDSLQVYKQGLRTTSGATNDYTILSRQRFRFNYPVDEVNVIVDYQTAFGSDSLYIKTHSFTSELAGNLGQTTYVLPEIPILFTEQVYIAGIRKTRDIDYEIADDTIEVLDVTLMDEATSFLVDYQTTDLQILTEYKIYTNFPSISTSVFTLEPSNSNVVLTGSHQVYVNGTRKELTNDYTISGVRNNIVTLLTAVDNCFVIVDYQI